MFNPRSLWQNLGPNPRSNVALAAELTSIEQSIDGKANASHGHAISDVTGLNSTLGELAISLPGHAWISESGNNATAELGDPRKPFATANAATTAGALYFHFGPGMWELSNLARDGRFNFYGTLQSFLTIVYDGQPGSDGVSRTDYDEGGNAIPGTPGNDGENYSVNLFFASDDSLPITLIIRGGLAGSGGTDALGNQALPGINGTASGSVQHLGFEFYAKDVDPAVSFVQWSGFASKVDLSYHTNNYNNPHVTTKAQVGLGSVENAAASALYIPKIPSSFANRMVRTVGTGGNVQLTGITVDDSNNVSGVAGITAGGNLSFTPDNTHDVAAYASGRPRDVFIGRSLTIRDVFFTTPIEANALDLYSPSGQNGLTLKTFFGNSFRFARGTDSNQVIFHVTGEGVLAITDNSSNTFANVNRSFNRLQLGGTTSSYPSIKRSGTTSQFRLADDSADAPIACSNVTASGNASFQGGSGFAITMQSEDVSGTGPKIVRLRAGQFDLNQLVIDGGSGLFGRLGVQTLQMDWRGLSIEQAGVGNIARFGGLPTSDGPSLQLFNAASIPVPPSGRASIGSINSVLTTPNAFSAASITASGTVTSAYQSSASDPSGSDIPSGSMRAWLNTSSNLLFLAANVGGTIRKAAFT